MHVNYIIIFTEKNKYNVTVNKTFKYNVVIVIVQNSSKNALCWEVHQYILLGGRKVTKIFCMAPKG